jgi:hypothetical protein
MAAKTDPHLLSPGGRHWPPLHPLRRRRPTSTYMWSPLSACLAILLVKDGIKCIKIQITIAFGIIISQMRHKYRYFCYFIILGCTGLGIEEMDSCVFWFLCFQNLNRVWNYEFSFATQIYMNSRITQIKKITARHTVVDDYTVVRTDP